MKLKILDLFSGIGGFSLGLERTGNFKTVAFCEIDKYCKLLLQKHWKGVKIYDDVKEITKERLEADGIESPDIITGGFPCQSFSVAGRRKGTDDSRYLWPEMFRIIKIFKSKFVIGENVRGIVNIQNGMVFEAVCSDLESEGYEVQPFLIPAAGVGAPHRRERIFFIASLENARRTLRPGTELGKENENEIKEKDANQHQRPSRPSESNVADTESKSSEFFSNRGSDDKIKKQPREETGQSNRSSRGQDVADTKNIGTRKLGYPNQTQRREGSHSTQPDSSSSTQRKQGWWDVEPDVGRVAHGVSGRVHRLRALGNSIIPKIAEEIGRAIIKANS
jgi:DNA (cytosine-5)-methyltransferase 1